jgi:hypothetical protein
MREFKFHVPRTCDLGRAERLIERVCNEHGLQLGMKGTQAKFPGSIHWHFKRPRQKGTLELTIFIPERRIWAQVQDGRRAPWIDDELPVLQRTIEKGLKSLAS